MKKNIKQILLLTILSVILPFCIFAADPVVNYYPNTSKSWEVGYNGLHTSYLTLKLGTIGIQMGNNDGYNLLLTGLGEFTYLNAIGKDRWNAVTQTTTAKLVAFTSINGATTETFIYSGSNNDFPYLLNGQQHLKNKNITIDLVVITYNLASWFLADSPISLSTDLQSCNVAFTNNSNSSIWDSSNFNNFEFNSGSLPSDDEQADIFNGTGGGTGTAGSGSVVEIPYGNSSTSANEFYLSNNTSPISSLNNAVGLLKEEAGNLYLTVVKGVADITILVKKADNTSSTLALKRIDGTEEIPYVLYFGSEGPLSVNNTFDWYENTLGSFLKKIYVSGINQNTLNTTHAGEYSDTIVLEIITSN
ncbi:MAG: hypothetical protein WC162_00755 [Sphaerochaetaceae bacterium]|nr:hypothetical protein [Sphaerochaetaceae bacterium]